MISRNKATNCVRLFFDSVGTMEITFNEEAIF